MYDTYIYVYIYIPIYIWSLKTGDCVGKKNCLCKSNAYNNNNNNMTQVYTYACNAYTNVYARLPTRYIINGTDVGHFRIWGSTETIAFSYASVYKYTRAISYIIYVKRVYIHVSALYTWYMLAPSPKYIFSFIRR